MTDLRLFIAFGLPPPVREAIAGFQRELQAFPGDVKWEAPEKFHGTIRFLGPTSPSRCDLVREALRAVAAAASPFELIISGFGAFPTMRDPKVFWVGCENRDGALTALAADVSRAMAQIGYPPDERPFHPHITLGRVNRTRRTRRPRRPPGTVPGRDEPHWWSQTHLTARVKSLNFSPRHAVVGGILLMESMLRPFGSEYRSIEEFSLTSGEKWAQNEGSDV